MILHLKEIIALAEDLLVLQRRFLGILIAVLLKEARNFARKACREGDNALVVLGEQLSVHARPIIEAFRIAA